MLDRSNSGSPSAPPAPADPGLPLRPDDVPAPGDPPSVRTRRSDDGRGWVMEAVQWLPRRVDELFPFFAEAGNLDRITPASVRFEIVTPQPIQMAAGALIDYRLRIRGVPVRWRTRIAVWEPGVETGVQPGQGASRRWRFVDEQVKGPYRRWVHEHRFRPMLGRSASGELVEGTCCEDSVHYEVPGGPLASLINVVLVGPDVRSIFRFRAGRMNELFGA